MSKFQSKTSGYRVKHLAEMTGISAHVLRKWEQRYNLLAPQRADNGYRVFNQVDLQLLLYIKSQLALGKNIGQLALQGRNALLKEMNSGPIDLSRIPVDFQPQVANLLEAARKGDQATVDQTIYLLVQQYGFDQALTDIFFPVLRSIGELWHQGRIDISGEHSVSQTIHRLLAEDHHLQNGTERPQALVVCMPNDFHEIGAVAAMRILQRNGWKAIYLGTDSSIDIIRLACQRRHGQLVLLSCVVEPSPDEMKRCIDDIVKRLLPITTVVIGGKGASLYIDWLERKNIRYIGEMEGVKELTPRSLGISQIA